MRQLFWNPLTPLCVFTVETTLLYTAAIIAGVGISPAMQLAVGSVSLLLLLMWIEADARHRHQTPCFDFGYLCALFLPLSVFWYCLWSRGWKGLGILTLLGVLWIAPSLAANITWWLLYGVG